MITGEPSASVRNAFRSVEGALLAVHLMLATRYWRIAALQSVAPVHDHFFPAPLRHPALVLAAFFAPIVTEAMVLQHPDHGEMKRAAVVETLGASVLLLQQATYFYATWVVVFWSGLFLIWMAWSAATDMERARTVGPFLAQLLTAFFFAGGAVGKWTAAYWSGDVFYDLFLARHPYWLYVQLRGWFSAEALRVVAAWFSRSVVVVETAMTLVLVLPARLASTVSIVAALGLWLTNADLFEVSWPLMGVALAGRLLARPSPLGDAINKAVDVRT